MLFSFGQENPSQSCKSADNLKKTNTEIQIFPSFKGEIYSSKTVSGLFKRNQDDIVYASYSSDEQVLDQESDLIPDLYEGKYTRSY